MLAIEPTQTQLDFTGRGAVANSIPGLLEAGQIVGMNGGLPAATHRLQGVQSGILAPALIEKLDSTVGEQGADESRQRVDEMPEFKLHSPSY